MGRELSENTPTGVMYDLPQELVDGFVTGNVILPQMNTAIAICTLRNIFAGNVDHSTFWQQLALGDETQLQLSESFVKARSAHEARGRRAVPMDKVIQILHKGKRNTFYTIHNFMQLVKGPTYAFLGPASTVAANAAECAQDQGKFWAFHDYMYKNQPAETDTSIYNTDSLTTIAGQLGMDTNTFRDCLSNNKGSDRANKDFSEGQTAGVSGTPTIFINGIPVVGAQPYSAFQQVIDQELAKK